MVRSCLKLSEIRIYHSYFLFIRINSFWLYTNKNFLKKDIRDIGSGNIGATNALRTGKNQLDMQL